MKKVMISQPMNGFTDEQIVETRNRFLEFAKRENLEVVNTYFTDEWYSKDSMTERGVVQIPICFLAKSIENMSLCHIAYFAKGWENARGCKIEHEIAKQYGLEIIYEDAPDSNNIPVDNNTNFREIAVKLWDLLDDIDTACDMFKPHDEESAMAYYRYVSEKTIERHKYLKSDGYKLYTLDEYEQLPKDKPQARVLKNEINKRFCI